MKPVRNVAVLLAKRLVGRSLRRLPFETPASPDSSASQSRAKEARFGRQRPPNRYPALVVPERSQELRLIYEPHLTLPGWRVPVHTEFMQLRTARLCLDCEELHEEQTCPICASESFAFISRWVPSQKRQQRPRRVVEAPPARMTADKRSSAGKVVKSIAGLAALSLAGWAWQKTRHGDASNAPASDGPRLARPEGEE